MLIVIVQTIVLIVGQHAIVQAMDRFHGDISIIHVVLILDALLLRELCDVTILMRELRDILIY